MWPEGNWPADLCVYCRKHNDYFLIYSFWFDTAASYRDIPVLCNIVEPKNYQVYILFTKLAPFLPQSWDLLEKLPLVLSVYIFCIILSDAYISISSLSGSLHMFITSWWLIKRSPQTLESENNYMFTKRWSGWILLPL